MGLREYIGRPPRPSWGAPAHSHPEECVTGESGTSYLPRYWKIGLFFSLPSSSAFLEIPLFFFLLSSSPRKAPGKCVDVFFSLQFIGDSDRCSCSLQLMPFLRKCRGEEFASMCLTRHYTQAGEKLFSSLTDSG